MSDAVEKNQATAQPPVPAKPSFDVEKLEGVEKAAILLLSLSEEDAAQILKHLEPKQVQKVGIAMAQLDDLSQDKISAVHSLFIEQIQDYSTIGFQSEDFIKKALTAALGEDKAATLLDQIILGGGAKGLESLKWMDSKQVANIIRNEHPQIQTIVLSYLAPDQSAENSSTLEVVTIPFNKVDEFSAADLPIYQQDWFQPMVRTISAMLVVVVLIVFLVKPLLTKLLSPEETTDSYDEESLGGVDLGDEALDMLNTEFDEKDIGFAADGTLQLPDLHGDEDLLKAVRALVANEPELSSQVVKGWLLEDE